jgi:hypothetical protein
MSHHLRYGPRFGQASISNKVGYDEQIDRNQREDRARFAALAHQPLHKRELRYHNNALAHKKTMAKRTPGPEREEAEQRMAEAVRKCVEILEFHMEDMIQHRKVTGRPHYCAQLTIHNVIVELRNKCGVSFSKHNPAYEHRQSPEIPRGDKEDYRQTERDQQRFARERNLREMANRFARMHNKKVIP